jgi:hypothetical protein
MRISRHLPVFILVMALSACGSMSIVKLYDGPPRDPSQIATLVIDPHVLVSRVDNITEHPGDKSRVLAHSAGKRRESIALAPGPHDLSARFFVLCLQSVSEVPLRFTAEPGKKYRLKSVVDMGQKRWRPEIVEYHGEEIEDTFPWTQAMCKVQVNIIRLGR